MAQQNQFTGVAMMPQINNQGPPGIQFPSKIQLDNMQSIANMNQPGEQA
jgi:hypothetical protein